MGKSKNAPTPSVDDLVIVLPGDNVTKYIEFGESPTKDAAASVPKLGTGLRFNDRSRQVYATCPGQLEQHKNRNVYYIKQNLRRYRPVTEDRVVGIVEDRAGTDGMGGDLYRVNINGRGPAILSSLQFEGASKRNKPQFTPGQLLYARVLSLQQNVLDPELSCKNGPHDTGIPVRDWMTNEGCYGELRGGTCCQISTALARQLLHPDCTVLTSLAKLPFEVAIGVNGYLWIHSALPQYTVVIQNAVQNSEVLTDSQVRAMVQSLLHTAEKQLQRERDVVTAKSDHMEE